MKPVYRVILKLSAVKDLKKLPVDIFSEIDKAIDDLAKDPRPFGVKKLEGYLHRVRVRRWRVLYAIYDKEAKVVVFRVRRRNEKTYKNL